jgi:hypothetical protein
MTEVSGGLDLCECLYITYLGQKKPWYTSECRGTLRCSLLRLLTINNSSMYFVNDLVSGYPISFSTQQAPNATRVTSGHQSASISAEHGEHKQPRARLKRLLLNASSIQKDPHCQKTFGVPIGLAISLACCLFGCAGSRGWLSPLQANLNLARSNHPSNGARLSSSLQ